MCRLEGVPRVERLPGILALKGWNGDFEKHISKPPAESKKYSSKHDIMALLLQAEQV